MLFFTGAMKHVFIFIASVLCLVSCNSALDELKPENAKVAIRTIGHELLLVQKDSSSLVLPVESVSKSSYKLEFQKDLAIQPGHLVSIVKRVFEKASISEDYLVEVFQCEDGQVAYSYQMYQKENIEIIPCLGRELPKSGYYIIVNFSVNKVSSHWPNWLFLSMALALCAIAVTFFYSRKSQLGTNNGKEILIGSFTFFPEQLKLVKQATEITMSRKECEILELFVERPNQIITREELTKRIWEDNGVIVGRSLDTYVSKLRKKLQDDASIKITNVHGVGYKLEVGV